MPAPKLWTVSLEGNEEEEERLMERNRPCCYLSKERGGEGINQGLTNYSCPCPQQAGQGERGLGMEVTAGRTGGEGPRDGGAGAGQAGA